MHLTKHRDVLIEFTKHTKLFELNRICGYLKMHESLMIAKSFKWT